MNNVFLKKSIAAKETVILRPFVYTKPSVRASVLSEICLLVPQLLALFATRSFSSLFVILAAVIASVLSEFVNLKKYRRHHDTLAISIAQGLFTGMFLPETFPLLAVFCITFFVFTLVKNAFETFSGSWVNPVAIVVAIAYFTGTQFFPSAIMTSDFAGSVNIGGSIYQSGVLEPLKSDFSLTPFLNEKVLSFFGISLPTGYVSLFIDNGSSIPAFRFNALNVISSLILFSLDMVSCVLPISTVAVYLILVRTVGSFFAGGLFFQGDMLFALLTGGVLFCVLFVLPWYGTIPYTTGGRIFYGAVCGFILFVIAGLGSSPAGCIFTVLVANTVSPFIQLLEDSRINRHVLLELFPEAKSMKEAKNA